MTQPTEEQIAHDLMLAGEDPNDPLARQLYLDALAATKPPRISKAPPQKPLPGGGGITKAFKAATGMTDQQIAELLDMSRSLVQSMIAGHSFERLDRQDVETMHKRAIEQLAAVQEILKVLEERHGRLLT